MPCKARLAKQNVSEGKALILAGKTWIFFFFFFYYCAQTFTFINFYFNNDFQHHLSGQQRGLRRQDGGSPAPPGGWRSCGERELARRDGGGGGRMRSHGHARRDGGGCSHSLGFGAKAEASEPSLVPWVWFKLQSFTGLVFVNALHTTAYNLWIVVNKQWKCLVAVHPKLGSGIKITKLALRFEHRWPQLWCPSLWKQLGSRALTWETTSFPSKKDDM